MIIAGIVVFVIITIIFVMNMMDKDEEEAQ